MNENRASMEKKRKFRPFSLFLLIYAVVVLIVVAIFLNGFYDYIAAYENSRIKHVLSSYIDNLTAEHVAEASQDVIAQVDHHIQSEAECRAYITESLSGGFSYAKKSGDSTDERHVYVLRSGKQVIGQFVAEAVREDEYGFTYWQVTEESFDISYLIGEKVSIVAPDHYTVTVNGSILDYRYIIGERIEYEVLHQFYDSYDLPVMVTYQAGPFLGNFEMVVTDPEGNTVDMDTVKDLNKLAQNCSESEVEALDPFIDVFLEHYVVYMSGSNKTADYNLSLLMRYVVKGSDFAKRMEGALFGQRVTQSRGDVIVDIQNNYYFKLDNGCYMCDVTYLVDTKGREGVVRTTNNVRIIVVETDDGLRVQTVYNY